MTDPVRISMQGRPLRVLLADDRLGYKAAGLHGGGRMMITWTKALADQGVDVTTVILRDPGEMRRDVGDLPFLFLGRNEFDPRTLADFVSLIRRKEIDVLHLQGHGASAFGRIAGVITGRPSFVHIHADYRLGVKGYPFYVKALDRLLAPATEKVLAVSSAIRGFAIEVQGYRSDKVDVLLNPVDLERFRVPTATQRLEIRSELGIPADSRVLITVGRLDRLKGMDLQIAAWPRIADVIKDAILLIVGDGPERTNLEEAAAQLPVGSVRFLGRRDDVPRLLWSADLFVLSSRSEGLPLVLLEAMGTGLPVVATRVGGIPEVVTHELNGTLVPTEDTGQLAAAVVQLLCNEGRRSSMADAARETAARFDLANTTRRLIEIYRSALA